MFWIALLATASLALADVDIITSPSPGNEYVKISGAPQDAANLTVPHVYVKDEGLSGLQQKPYPVKKADHAPLKKDTLGLKAIIKDEGLSGVVKKASGNNVPSLKHIDDSMLTSSPNYDVLSKKSKREQSGGLDFDDESPLSDKKLKPSATSQNSRINVKKGPNGQDYEYEYVYYYYDDVDEDGTSTAAPALSATPTRGHYEGDRPNTSRKPVVEPSEEPRTRGEVKPTEFKSRNVDSSPEPPRTRNEAESRGRGDSVEDHRGNHYRVAEVEDAEEEIPRRRPESRNEEKPNNRYTTIERDRTTQSGSRGRGEHTLTATTAEPSVNEVLPSRGSQRTRGRHVEASSIEDDRLPANTRFPSRSRGSSSATTASTAQTPQAPQQQSTRSRGNQGGSPTIRRPSLVDSSSFRTHSSDAAPDADLDKNYYRSSPVQDTRESDLEEYIQPELIRPTTYVPPLTTTILPPAPVQEQTDGTMPDKAALDLYAIIQQQQEENYVSGTGGDLAFQTEFATQPQETTTLFTTTTSTTTTTTTTTTTEPPTTTTTTTTTTPPPPSPSGRGRFRGAPGSRIRSRPGGATTSTTTETPKEEEAPRRKFSPTHGGRAPGQVSAYGRRGAGTRSSTTTAAPTQDQEVSTTRPRASFGGNNRFSNNNRARVRPTAAPVSSAAPPEEEATQESTSVAPTHSRPTRPRLNVSPATRPLRPGPRINLRGRGGLSTQAPPPSSSAAPVEEEPSPIPATNPPPAAPAEEEASPTPPAPTDALSRLRNRPRLKVTPRLPGSPSAPAPPRPAPQGFKRPGRPLSQAQANSAPEEPAQAPTEPAPAATEAPAQPSEVAPTDPPPPPHLARRRPAIRRLQIPINHNQ